MLAGWLGALLFTANLRFAELLVLAALMPARQGWDLAQSIRKHLQAGELAKARMELDGTPWRHHALLDEHGAARAAIELLTVQFSEKIVSPMLWYLLFGLPGLLVCAAITLLHEALAPAAAPSRALIKPRKRRTGWCTGCRRVASALLWLVTAIFLYGRKKPLILPPGFFIRPAAHAEYYLRGACALPVARRAAFGLCARAVA